MTSSLSSTARCATLSRGVDGLGLGLPPSTPLEVLLLSDPVLLGTATTEPPTALEPRGVAAVAHEL